MHRPDIFQLHVGIVKQQPRELGVDDNRFRMFERAIEANFAIGLAMRIEGLQMQRIEEKRIKVDILDGNFAVERIGLRKSQGVAAGYFSRGHRRTNLKMGGTSV